jgi:hypothetical protein
MKPTRNESTIPNQNPTNAKEAYSTPPKKEIGSNPVPKVSIAYLRDA